MLCPVILLCLDPNHRLFHFYHRSQDTLHLVTMQLREYDARTLKKRYKNYVYYKESKYRDINLKKKHLQTFACKHWSFSVEIPKPNRCIT